MEDFPSNLRKLSMESTAYFRKIYGNTAYFHRIYGIVPWNPLNFHGINDKNLWHFMNFHHFLLLVYLPSTAMETLKTPSEYSVDLNPRFQGFSMANLEKGAQFRHSAVPLVILKLTLCSKVKHSTTEPLAIRSRHCLLH